jgi:hypothetical protein
MEVFEGIGAVYCTYLVGCAAFSFVAAKYLRVERVQGAA